MKKILIIGAGRSATTMIKYLLDHAEQEDWMVTVADFNEALAVEKVGGHVRGRALKFDVYDEALRKKEIADADLVISLLPPHMHIIPARDCLADRTHLVTASYVSKELAALDAEAKAADLLFLNEVGADPGIDHMSAMEMVDRIKDKGGKLLSFRSYCGALIAPDYNNMWGYKFTWAPRNIIVAGQGIA
ncbi:MAG: saccharopine dehydrogenase C-terminal domain-containing protein, partial [Bacteroidota bacterium]